MLRLPSGARRVAQGAAAGLSAGPTGRALAIGRALVLTGSLSAIFGALFASGDRAFAQLAGDVLPDSLPLDDLPARLIVFGLVMSFAGGLAQAAAVADEPAGRPLLRLGRLEWLLALGALNALFALFVGVQLAVLFGGDEYVRDTAGLTYAQYARAGFAQLVVVAALTLGVVASALRWARAERARDALILRALLGALCVLTLVVLASALHRLGLWLGDPDRRIASHNVERYESTGRIDLVYLSGLSADAVPALLRLAPPLRERALARQRERLAGAADGLAAANRARARARDALAAGGP